MTNEVLNDQMIKRMNENQIVETISHINSSFCYNCKNDCFLCDVKRLNENPYNWLKEVRD